MTLCFHVTLLSLRLPGAFSVFLCVCQQCLTHCGRKCQYAVRLVLTPVLKIWKIFFPFTCKSFLKSILRNLSPVNSKVFFFFFFSSSLSSFSFQWKFRQYVNLWGWKESVSEGACGRGGAGVGEPVLLRVLGRGARLPLGQR